MNGKKLPRCPYCGKQLNFFEAFNFKSKGEYYCKACLKSSKINFNKSMYTRSWICELVSLVILLVFVIFTPSKSLLTVFAVLCPFLFFYTFVPFEMVLSQCEQVNIRKEIEEKNKVAKGETVNFYVPKSKTQSDKETNSIETSVDETKIIDKTYQTAEIPLSKIKPNISNDKYKK